MRKVLPLFFVVMVFGCTETPIPKPQAYLSLSYPKKQYDTLPLKRPYAFDVPKNVVLTNEPNHWLKISYPRLKASVHLTYRPVENNLTELLAESERLVFKHTVKAEEIIPKDFTNPEKKVFGSLYEITGNAASQIQFHATDSTQHFVKGALYFYTKPNYDSLLPAIAYIKQDVIRLIESLEWKYLK